MTAEKNRPLTDVKLDLVRWMLEHGTAEAKPYLDQVEFAEVISLEMLVRVREHHVPNQGTS